MKVNGMRSAFPSEPFVVLNVDQFVGHGGGPLERQKQDSHVYRKTSTLPLIFQKNQSRHYINDEVRNCKKGDSYVKGKFLCQKFVSWRRHRANLHLCSSMEGKNKPVFLSPC